MGFKARKKSSSKSVVQPLTKWQEDIAAALPRSQVEQVVKQMRRQIKDAMKKAV
jgi:hypothetical protein